MAACLEKGAKSRLIFIYVRMPSKSCPSNCISFLHIDLEKDRSYLQTDSEKNNHMTQEKVAIIQMKFLMTTFVRPVCVNTESDMGYTPPLELLFISIILAFNINIGFSCFTFI